jgi:hypothetical protein
VGGCRTRCRRWQGAWGSGWWLVLVLSCLIHALAGRTFTRWGERQRRWPLARCSPPTALATPGPACCAGHHPSCPFTLSGSSVGQNLVPLSPSFPFPPPPQAATWKGPSTGLEWHVGSFGHFHRAADPWKRPSTGHERHVGSFGHFHHAADPWKRPSTGHEWHVGVVWALPSRCRLHSAAAKGRRRALCSETP